MITRVPPLTAGALLLLLSQLLPARAQIPVSVRAGDHPGFGRVVFDTSANASYQLARDGNRLTVRFTGDVALSSAPHQPHNVLTLRTNGAVAELTLVPDSTFRAARLGGRVVIDVFDPVRAGSAPEPAGLHADPTTTPLRLPPPPPLPDRETAASPADAAIDSAGNAVPSPNAAPVSQSVASSSPATALAARTTAHAPLDAMPPTSAAVPQRGRAMALAANVPELGPAEATDPPARSLEPAGGAATTPSRRVADAVGTSGGDAAAPQPVNAIANPPGEPLTLAVTLVSLPDSNALAFAVPLAPTAGAAVLQRHGATLIVFDERRAIDLSALQAEPAFASARVVMLPDSTLIRVTPPRGTAISLSKTAQGWIVAALAAPPSVQPITTAPAEAQLHIAADAPSHVVTLTDPETGDPLLVGTQRQSGEAVLMPRQTPQFSLLRTQQGVAVATSADAVTLRVVSDGFVLGTAPEPLALSRDDVDVLGDAASLTRRFDFPNLPADQLLRALSADIAAAAAQPMLARGGKRRDAALAMISLGMGAEAESLLQVTTADDPRQAGSADAVGLTAIAALLAGRVEEADGIDDARLNGTDEVLLWRALRGAMRDETSRFAATALAGSAALLLAYPPAMRDRMLPMAAETMVQGGTVAAAKALLARAGKAPGLELARAMLSQASGDTGAALAQYDALAAGHDQLSRARAAVRAVELRMATHQYDARQAAEALDRLLYAWRGDRRELNLRERLAALRQQLGEWREALTLLRDSEALFPDSAKAIHAKLQATFDAMLQDGGADKLPPIAFVTLVDENADLLPATAAGEAIQASLADRLLALDLPDHAGPILDKLMNAAPAGPARAAYGARLAALRLRQDDANGALAALAASDAAELDAVMTEQRLLLRADAQARLGDAAGAIGALAGLGSPAADAERASIYEQSQDWNGAERALTAYAAHAVPAHGPLNDDARRLLLRLATAAARAGDQAALDLLRARDEQRMGGGPLAEMFRLLTEDTVHGPGDLEQVSREIGYARALPANLQAMQPAAHSSVAAQP